MRIKKVILISTMLALFPTFGKAGSEAFVSFYTSKEYISHINKGYIALDAQNYPMALKEFMTAKYLDDKLSAAYEGLAKIYEETNNTKEALETYHKAISLTAPKYSAEEINQIRIYKEKRNLKNAFLMYKKVLSIRPEAGLQLLFGDSYLKQGSRSQALVSYKRAYELQESPEGYIKYLKIKNTNKEYERFVVRKYIEKNLGYPEAHFKAGLINMYFGNYASAIDEFKSSVNQITLPNYENKYIFYLAQANYKYAISFKNPNVEHLQEAIKLFEKYLNYDKKNVKALFSLADSYFYSDIAKMNSYNKEQEELEREFLKVANFSSKDPEYMDAKDELFGLLNRKYNPKLFDRSIAILEKINRIDSYEAGIYYSLGSIYFKKGNNYHKGFYDRYKVMSLDKAYARDQAFDFYQKAIEQYREYIKRNPYNSSFAYYDIGIAYYQCSKLEPNVNNLPITSDNKAQYKTWGSKFYRRDMLNKAINNMTAFVSNNPKSAQVVGARNLIKEMELARL